MNHATTDDLSLRAKRDGDAYAYVCSDSDPQWHSERQRLVTASLAAVLLGVNRYGSRLSAYLRMREGLEVERIAPDRRDAMDWGTDLQDAVVANIGRRLGLRSYRCGWLLRSLEWPCLGCTLDGWVEDPRADGMLVPFEVKSDRSPSAAERWNEGVPRDVMPQVQAQMAVTGAQRVLVAVVILGAQPVFAWVERDEAMIASIAAEAELFMERVLAGMPPEPDGSEIDTAAVAALANTSAGKVINLGIDAVVLWDDLQQLKAKQAQLNHEAEQLKQLLIRRLGDAEEGVLPGGGRLTYKTTKREGCVKLRRFDRPTVVQALHEATGLPVIEIADQVTESQGCEFRTLRHRRR